MCARWLGALAGVCSRAGKCSWFVPQLCVCVCVLGGGLHLDTAGVCGGTVANGDLFPCQTFKV